MSVINVLVFPAGEVNSIEIHDALSNCVNIRVIGASSIDRHGSYVFSNYYKNLPLISEVSFLEALNSLIEKEKVDLIFPTHDTVAVFLKENQKEIKAKVVGPNIQTAKICRDKLLTYQLFSDCDFAPKLLKKYEGHTLFSKPRIGQGSQGTKVINSTEELNKIDLETEVVSEYLPGEELTVDCLSDAKGKLIFASPRKRSRIMAGISVAAQTETLTKEVRYIANVLNNRLNFCGLWWFQIKKDNKGKFKLLEVSCRCASTMSVTRALGVNLPLLTAYISMGLPVEIKPQKYEVKMDSTLIRRYKLSINYKYVYIDFDDTIVFNGKVNLKAVWFIYQTLNSDKDIILITRHKSDILTTLKNYKLAPEIFKQIIVLDDFTGKSSAIKNLNSIFIDNSWKERFEVSNKLGIPVFDVDGFDFLMSWVK